MARIICDSCDQFIVKAKVLSDRLIPYKRRCPICGERIEDIPRERALCGRTNSTKR